MGLVINTLAESISYKTITTGSNLSIYNGIRANYTDENIYRTVSPVAKSYILENESYTSLELLKAKDGSNYRYIKTLGPNPVGFFAYLEPVDYSYDLNFTSAYTLLQEKYLDRDETIQMNWQKTSNRHFNATSYNTTISYFDTLYKDMYDSFLAVKRCDEESKNAIRDFANAMDFEDVTYVSSYFESTGSNTGKFYARMFTTNIQNTNLFYKSSDNIFISYDGSVRLFDGKEGWIAAYSSSNPEIFSVTQIPKTNEAEFSGGNLYSSTNPIYPCYICIPDDSLRAKGNALINFNDYSVVISGPYIKTLFNFDANFSSNSRKVVLFNSTKGTSLCQLSKNSTKSYNNIAAVATKIDDNSLKLSFKFYYDWLYYEFTEKDPYISQDTYQVIIGAEPLCRIRFYRGVPGNPEFLFTTNNYKSADYLDILTVSLTSNSTNEQLKNYGLKISSVDIVSGTESIFPVHPLLYWSNDTSFKIICTGRGSYKVNITYWHPQLNTYLRETLAFNIKSFGKLKSELQSRDSDIQSGNAITFSGVQMPACVIPKINGVANDYTVNYNYTAKTVTVNINANKPINVLYWINLDNSVSCKYISNGTSSISLVQPLALDSFYEFAKLTDDSPIYAVDTQPLISPFVKISLSLMEDKMSNQMIGNINNRLVSNESIDYSYLTKLEIDQISYHNIPNLSSTETKRIGDRLDLLMNSVSDEEERQRLINEEKAKLNRYAISRPELLNYVNILDTTYTSQNEFAANVLSFGDDFPYKCSPWNVMPCITVDNNAIDFSIDDFYNSIEDNIMYYPTQKNYKISFKPNENIDPDYYTANINIRLSKKDKINIMFNWKEVHYVKDGKRCDGLMINADSLEISGMLDGHTCVAKLQNNCELDIQTNTLTLLKDVSLMNEFGLMLCATNSKKRVDLTFNVENYMIVCDDVFALDTTNSGYDEFYLNENETYEIAVDKDVLKKTLSNAWSENAKNYLKDNSNIKVKLLFNSKTIADVLNPYSEKYYTSFNVNKSFILNMKEIVENYGYYAFGIGLYVKNNENVDVAISKLIFRLAFDGYRKCRTIYRRLLTYPIYYFNDSVSKYFENEHYDDILPDEQFYSRKLSNYVGDSEFINSSKLILKNDYSSITLGSVVVYNFTYRIGNKIYYPKTIQYSGYFLYYLNYIRLRKYWQTNCDTNAVIYHMIDLDKFKISDKPDKIQDILGKNTSGDVYYTGEYEIFNGEEEPSKEPDDEFDEYDLNISPLIATDVKLTSTNLFQYDYFVNYREDILKYWKDRIDAYQYILDVLSEYDENLGLLDILQRYARKTGKDVQEKIAKIGYILTGISQNNNDVSLWVSAYYADKLWNPEANAYMWRNIFEILFENDIDLALINNSILQDIFAFGFFPEIYVCDTKTKYYLNTQGKISTSGVKGLYHYNFNKQGEIETIQVETKDKRPVQWKKTVESVNGYKVTNGVLTYNNEYYVLTASGKLKKSDKPGTGYSISGKTIIRTIGEQNVSYCSTEDISGYWISYNQDCFYKVSKKNIRTALKIQLYLSRIFLSEIEKSVHMINILNKWNNVSDKYKLITKSGVTDYVLNYEIDDVIFNKKIIHASDINSSIQVRGVYSYYNIYTGVITKQYAYNEFTIPFPENYTKSIYTYSLNVGDKNLELTFFLPAYNDKFNVDCRIDGRYVVVTPKNERISPFKIFYKNDMEEPYPWSDDVNNTFDNITLNNYDRISHYSRKDVSGSYNTSNINIKAFNDIYRQPFATYMVAYNGVSKWGCSGRAVYAQDYLQSAHYLGSVTEWQVVQDNVVYINSFLSQIGGDLFYDGSINTDYDSSKYFWTSTEMNGEEAWMMFFDECIPKRMHKHELHYLRPFAKTDFKFEGVELPTPQPKPEDSPETPDGINEIRLIVINNDGTFIKTSDTNLSTINTDIRTVFKYANFLIGDFVISEQKNISALIRSVQNSEKKVVTKILEWPRATGYNNSSIKLSFIVKNKDDFGSNIGFYYMQYNENNENVKLQSIYGPKNTTDYLVINKDNYLRPSANGIYNYLVYIIDTNIHIPIHFVDSTNVLYWEYDDVSVQVVYMYMDQNDLFIDIPNITIKNINKDAIVSHWNIDFNKIANENGYEIIIKPKIANNTINNISEEYEILFDHYYPATMNLKLTHNYDFLLNSLYNIDFAFVSGIKAVHYTIEYPYDPSDTTKNSAGIITSSRTFGFLHNSILTITEVELLENYSSYTLSINKSIVEDRIFTITKNMMLVFDGVLKIAKQKIFHVIINPAKGGKVAYKAASGEMVTKEDSFDILYDNSSFKNIAGQYEFYFEAKPNIGWKFIKWETAGGTKDYENIYEIFTTFEDRTVTVTFEENIITVPLNYSITIILKEQDFVKGFQIGLSLSSTDPSMTMIDRLLFKNDERTFSDLTCDTLYHIWYKDLSNDEAKWTYWIAVQPNKVSPNPVIYMFEAEDVYRFKVVNYTGSTIKATIVSYSDLALYSTMALTTIQNNEFKLFYDYYKKSLNLLPSIPPINSLNISENNQEAIMPLTTDNIMPMASSVIVPVDSEELSSGEYYILYCFENDESTYYHIQRTLTSGARKLTVEIKNEEAPTPTPTPKPTPTPMPEKYQVTLCNIGLNEIEAFIYKGTYTPLASDRTKPVLFSTVIPVGGSVVITQAIHIENATTGLYETYDLEAGTNYNIYFRKSSFGAVEPTDPPRPGLYSAEEDNLIMPLKLDGGLVVENNFTSIYLVINKGEYNTLRNLAV